MGSSLVVGLNRGGGNVSTVGEDTVVSGDSSFAAGFARISNFGDDMDRGEGVVAALVLFGLACAFLVETASGCLLPLPVVEVVAGRTEAMVCFLTFLF